MEKLVQEVKNEGSIHKILKELGFSTNFNKKLSENGVDIVALKSGNLFKIEHKSIKINNKTRAYKLTGKINGDIIATTPKGRSFFMVTKGSNLTKTCRFIDSL